MDTRVGDSCETRNRRGWHPGCSVGRDMARDLHVTSPMMSGADVLDLQQRLADLGYPPGVLDGSYGPTTAAAVQAFQADQGLGADGVLGKATRAALGRARDPAALTSSALGLKALATAEKFLDVGETPPGSKRTPFGTWFGVDGVAWCNIFVSYCFARGAGYVIVDGFPGGKAAGIYPGKGCSYVPTTEAWLQVTGMWLGQVPPLPGDIAIYNWDGGRPDHIGLVSRDLGGGDFEAIEGNTSLSNNSNGGQVLRRVRHLTQVDGFGRVTG